MPPSKAELFTPRDVKIIKMICRQMSCREIGEKLYLSERTIEDLRQDIIKKMKVRNTAGLVVYAIKKGIFPV